MIAEAEAAWTDERRLALFERIAREMPRVERRLYPRNAQQCVAYEDHLNELARADDGHPQPPRKPETAWEAQKRQEAMVIRERWTFPNQWNVEATA
jgi:hypothetical protein